MNFVFTYQDCDSFDNEVFVDNWFQNLIGERSIELFDKLVTEQEIKNKPKKNLLGPGVKEEVDDWVGLNGLNYRFPNARTIIKDIKQGLEG